ncbi:hypothetical protein [Streptomyces corynorhini]|uniref:Uncharacterized protein n=1 Tax=Streptomyces corynorhini TaxID=2282652 RepID=A0A370B1Y4_9ACTN|nr:hypothetical protein [Streptomyces corynorhini]RDG35828.1 hypothetical protein DVH02_23150 [Streptomyces corynorhini]
MAVDPTDPDTFAPDDEDAENTDPSGHSAEVPEADAAEQRREVRQHGDDPLTHVDQDAASEGDVAEQARTAGNDEDDYRP